MATNPVSGLTLALQMEDDLQAANNLADVRTRTAAWTNLGAPTTAVNFTVAIAKHQFLLQTDPTTGTFVGSLTDTAKTAGETIVVKKPVGSLCTVSAATVTGSYG